MKMLVVSFVRAENLLQTLKDAREDLDLNTERARRLVEPIAWLADALRKAEPSRFWPKVGPKEQPRVGPREVLR